MAWLDFWLETKTLKDDPVNISASLQLILVVYIQTQLLVGFNFETQLGLLDTEQPVFCVAPCDGCRVD